MKAIHLAVLCLAAVFAAPNFAHAAAFTCDDFANCFADEQNVCEDGDVMLGVTLGAVDGIGELLCFVGDPKCSCFTAITDENNPGNDFDEWSDLLFAEIDACKGTASGGRSLNGVAFGAATTHCTPTFAADVQPILQAACGTCHISASSGNFRMMNGLGDLVGVASEQSALPYVAAGDADGSYLFRKITNTHLEVGSGSQMPLGGMLPQSDIDTINAWIAGGAKP